MSALYRLRPSADMTPTHLVGAWLAAGSLAAGLLVLPPPGLGTSGWRALAVLGAAIALWFSEALPAALTGLLVIVSLVLLGVIPLELGLRGFADPSMALLLGVFLLGAAMEHTGFAARLALHILRLGAGSPRRTLFCVVAATVLFVFLIPTSAGRSAILVPIAASMAGAMGLQRGSPLGKAILLAIPITSLVFSSAVMTGAISMVYAAGLFNAVLGYRWTYLSWLRTMAPVGCLTLLCACALAYALFRPARASTAEGVRYIRDELEKMGAISGREWRVAVLCALMLGLWMTSSFHHLPVAVPALLAGVLSVLPRLGVMAWAEASRRISWDTIILFAAGLASALALQETGAVDWFASRLFGWVAALSPALMVAGVMVGVAMLRLAFSSVVAAMAVVLPIVFALARTAGVNPVWLGLVGVIASDLCLFLPMQSPTSMVAYATGYFGVRDFFRVGVVVAGILVLVTVVTALWYWPWLGIGIR